MSREESALDKRGSQSEVLSTSHGPVEIGSLGTGYPILALHGCPGGYDQGLVVGQSLSDEGFHVIAPSRPGYLRTPLESGRSTAEQADLMAALLDELHLNDVIAAFVLCRGKPLILAFTWMHGDESRAVAAKRVLGRVGDLGLTIECLLADRAFASAAGIDILHTTAPMIVPLIRRGKELAKRLDTQVSYWTEYAMYEGTAREVRFPVAICVSYQNGKRGKNGLLVRAYAACEQDARTPKQVEHTYRRRSAIETSFRTFREALAKTTTRDPGIRLVYVGVAFLLRNLWILVGWAVLAQPRRGGRALPRWFPFKRFQKWIGHALDQRLGWIWEVPTNGVGVPMSHRSAVAG